MNARHTLVALVCGPTARCRLVSTVSPAVAYGWSPDGRYFHTATLAPRMNVDNGVHIYKYNGAGPLASLPCVSV